MSTRVTQSMLNSQLLRNLNENLRKMDHLQNQLSSGKRINKPSDDPVGISFSMRYRSELGLNEQFQSNVNSALSEMSFTDDMLNQANNVLQRLRELAVEGANGPNPQDALDTISAEVGQLYQQMVNIGNSQFKGKYVFNGQLTNVKPYSLDDAANESSDLGSISYQIGVGVNMDINIVGNEVFGAPGSSSNIFQVMKDLQTALDSADYQGASQIIGNIDERMDHFLAVRAEVGAKMNRIELAEERLKDININLQSLQSKTEDADMAALITNIKTAENVYQASLAAGVKLIRPSLIDFLR